MTTAGPHKLNAPGDFCVEDGCCLSCAVPFGVAPDLFEWDGEGHCYVKQQPASTPQLDQMMGAIEVADLGCIRYKGTQKVIQIRLVEAGEGAQCDSLPPDLAAKHRSMSARRLTSEYGPVSKPSSSSGPSLLQRVLSWFRGPA